MKHSDRPINMPIHVSFLIEHTSLFLQINLQSFTHSANRTFDQSIVSQQTQPTTRNTINESIIEESISINQPACHVNASAKNHHSTRTNRNEIYYNIKLLQAGIIARNDLYKATTQ